MTEKTGITLAQYKKAYRKIKAKEGKIGFLINLTAYVVVNSLLVAINLLFVPQFSWFVFPLAGWGIGLIFHYTFGVHLINKTLDAEEAHIERVAGKM